MSIARLSWIRLALIAGLLVCSGSVSASPDRPTVQRLTSQGVTPRAVILTPDVIEDEEGRSIEVERGLFFVPENRRRSASRLIAVHFVRFPAVRPASPGRPPVFLLAGGPGWGFDLSDPLVFDEIERLRRTREVVYMSQRGYSGDPGLVSTFEVRYGAVPVDTSISAIDRAELDRATLAAALGQWQTRGMDVAGYDILNITDDLHDLRAALDYDRIVLRGCSFGSQWSLAYMRRWPGTVDRALLSGVEPLDYGYDSPRWLWASMERVAKAAEADADLAPFIPEGGLLEALKTVIARLEAKPAQVAIRFEGEDVTVPVTAEDLQGLITSLSLNRRRAMENLAQWPRFILEMHAGDYRFLAARIASDRARERSESLILPLLNHSVGISKARATALLAEPEAAWVGDPNVRDRVARASATTPQVDDDFRADRRISVPTLLVAGDYDWSTPVENAEHLASFLDAGRLVTVHGGRHCTETNHGELSAQSAEATARIYGFVDADFDRSTAQAFLATLPDDVTLAPIDFSPPSPASMYEEWLAAQD